MVGCEAAGCGHAVDMGMKLEALIPTMEHAEESDLGAQVAGIAGELQQGCGTGLEQEVEDHLLVLESERSEFARQSEDEMHVAGGQKFPFACLEPALARVALAPRTVPISARVV